jgi:eukaryotic-like serine/threonine-protein kinase
MSGGLPGLCPSCGTSIAGGPCSCLVPAFLRAAAEPEPQAVVEAELPSRVGPYTILAELGRGGMGVVYLARHAITEGTVALKMIRDDLLFPGALRLFRREMKLTERAKRVHIVPILHADEHAGRLYYTMPLFEDCLERRLASFRSPREAARLIRTVAQAVQYAHERGVLHLDLKPANVLLDRDGSPHVADFGIARLVGDPAALVHEGWTSNARLATPRSAASGTPGIGTPFYMLPERHTDRADHATTAADIYGLGAMLRQLLTGSGSSVPHTVESPATVVGEPAQSASLAAVDPDLAAICEKCLQPDPERRYRSAAALADDLGRALRGEPPEARALPLWGRIGRLVVRDPLMSASLLMLLCIAAVSVPAVLGILHQSRRALVESVMQVDGWTARFVADAIENQLKQQMAKVERMAADPAIAAIARGPVLYDASLMRPYQEQGFGLVGVYDRKGTILARWPEGTAQILGRDYAWRDYFRGACEAGDRLVSGAYVARSFESENDGSFNLSISAPIIEDGRCVGLVLASVLTDKALGDVSGVDRSDPRHKAVLVGPQDRNRGERESAFPRDYLVLIHDALQPAQGVRLPFEPELDFEKRFGAPRSRGRQFPAADAEPLTTETYRDPLANSQRWLAAFYPVGGTGLVIGVQSRHDRIDELIGFTRRALFLTLAAVLALLLLGWRAMRRRAS